MKYELKAVQVRTLELSEEVAKQILADLSDGHITADQVVTWWLTPRRAEITVTLTPVKKDPAA